MYIKPELITEEFDLEDVITASSAEPNTGSDTPGENPTEISTEPVTEPETISKDDFEAGPESVF